MGQQGRSGVILLLAMLDETEYSGNMTWVVYATKRRFCKELFQLRNNIKMIKLGIQSRTLVVVMYSRIIFSAETFQFPFNSQGTAKL